MIRTKFARAALVAAVAATVFASFESRGGALADESASASAVAEKAGTIVHLKYVWKRGETERRRAVAGTMVDASGLVLFSATSLGTAGTGRAKASATDLKIVFGSDPKEYPAVVVAQDTKVDLAFVQILDLEGRVVTAVDLSKPGAVDVGTPLWQVVRKPPGFDYAAVVGKGYVTSRVEKPRPMWGIAGDARFLGLPVYDGAGAILGIVTRQSGAEGGEEGRTTAGTFLLPLDQVGRSLDDAKKKVPEAVANAKAAKDKEKENEAEPAAMDGAPPAPPDPNSPDKPGEGK